MYIGIPAGGFYVRLSSQSQLDPSHSSNMTQAEIAEIVGLSQQRITQILGIQETSITRENNDEDKRRTLNDAEIEPLGNLARPGYLVGM